MRAVSEECGLQPVTTAMAFVYFEKLALQGRLHKQNRKLVAAASVLLAAKISSDLKKADVKQLIDVSEGGRAAASAVEIANGQNAGCHRCCNLACGRYGNRCGNRLARRARLPCDRCQQAPAESTVPPRAGPSGFG